MRGHQQAAHPGWPARGENLDGPVRSLAHGLERLSLLLLVGGGLFEFATGVLNVQLDYLFPGSFYTLHFYGAWVFFAAFLAHAAFKTPAALRNVRKMRDGEEKPGEERELVAPDPAPPTVSRRPPSSRCREGHLSAKLNLS